MLPEVMERNTRRCAMSDAEEMAVGDVTERGGLNPNARIPQVCGTCRSIRFKGAQAYYQEGGACAKSKESCRDYVRFEQEPCELYVLRPKATRERDKAEAERVGLLVNATNRRAHARRRF